MQIAIPELALVVLIGPSGAGKSTFARAHFKATEVLSSDACRGLVSDDENDQSATSDAFDLLHFIARKRNVRFPTLAAGAFRHSDHRFEWTRAEFGAWAERVAAAHGYHATIAPVGPADPEVGAPSQIAVFSRR